MENLIIDDEYVTGIGTCFQRYAEVLQSAVDDYVAVLEKIRSDAVTAGAFGDAVDAFAKYAKTLQNSISAMGSTIANTCNSFISEVDEKDKYLY